MPVFTAAKRIIPKVINAWLKHQESRQCIQKDITWQRKLAEVSKLFCLWYRFAFSLPSSSQIASKAICQPMFPRIICWDPGAFRPTLTFIRYSHSESVKRARLLLVMKKERKPWIWAPFFFFWLELNEEWIGIRRNVFKALKIQVG